MRETASENGRENEKSVLGIFEASVAAALLALHADERFGIVSTGKVWEELLTTATRQFVGGASARFAGVESTGLDAGEVAGAPEGEVRERVEAAVRRLVGRGAVGVVCLGCAGMVGMEGWVRGAVREEGGVRVVDGVKVGVGMVVALVRGGVGEVS